jgi:hypothetical protein
MKTTFLGEEGSAGINGSIEMDMDRLHSPPDESVIANDINYFGNAKNGSDTVDAWLEIWDYTGGCSYRGFVGGEGAKKSLFAFFDSAVIGGDLKQGYVKFIRYL